MSNASKSAAKKIEAKRRDLEELANSDLPCAEIAAELLEVCDDE